MPAPGGTTSREVSRILAAPEVDMHRLLPLVLDQLRAIAARHMAGEKKGHTLDVTALVNEAYLKLVGQEELGWDSKAHFFAAAAESMRRILIDHARKKGSLKRGGGLVRLPLDVLDLATRENSAEILSVDEAVSRLEEQDGRMADIVKLRFYAGLSEREVAKVLKTTDRTVRRDWVFARAFLQRELSRG